MFLHLFEILFRGGMSVPLHAGIHQPPGHINALWTPPRHTPEHPPEILFRGGMSVPLHAGIHQPPGHTPSWTHICPLDIPPWKSPTPPGILLETVNKRAVRILLECILVGAFVYTGNIQIKLLTHCHCFQCKRSELFESTFNF